MKLVLKVPLGVPIAIGIGVAIHGFSPPLGGLGGGQTRIGGLGGGQTRIGGLGGGQTRGVKDEWDLGDSFSQQNLLKFVITCD
jgi:hypothetical protein